MDDSSGSHRRLPTLNTQRLRHFNRVGWDGADGGLGGLTNSFRCCACQLVQSLAPAPNTHAGSSTPLSHMSLQHGGISISPRIEAASAPPAHLNVTRQWLKSVLTRHSLADSCGPRWRAQLPGGSNWDSGRPGAPRGGRTTSRLGPRARCRGAHETASPELWGSIATP